MQTRLRTSVISLLLLVTPLLKAGSAVAVEWNRFESDGSRTFSAEVEERFKQSFYDPQIYQPIRCFDNVYRLATELRSGAANSGRFEVLYLLNDRRADSTNSGIKLDWIHPQHGRGSPERWWFHVVLRWESTILDLDYTDSPILPEVRSYFEEMFPASELESLSVRVIPADEYARDFQPDSMDGPSPHHQSYYLLDTDSRYPLQSLKQYLMQ